MTFVVLPGIVLGFPGETKNGEKHWREGHEREENRRTAFCVSRRSTHDFHLSFSLSAHLHVASSSFYSAHVSVDPTVVVVVVVVRVTLD